METCIAKIKYKDTVSYAVWTSDEIEQFLTVGTRVALFASEEEAASLARSRSLEISKSADGSYDLDSLERWCRSQSEELSDYTLLKFWEFFCDIAYSVSESFASSGRSFILNDIYDKLCMTVYADSDDERFDLEDSEYELLRGVFSEGIRMFSMNAAR